MSLSLGLRRVINGTFTTFSGMSVALMVAALIVILSPLLWRGCGAVVFRSTAEFRRMQYDMHGRGSLEAVEAELAQGAEIRRNIYETIDNFSAGIDTQRARKRAKQTYRQFKAQIRNRIENEVLTEGQASDLTRLAETLRNLLLEAYDTTNRTAANEKLDCVLVHAGDERFSGLAAEQLFAQARKYQRIVAAVDLTRRDEYLDNLEEVGRIVRELLGPRPDGPIPDLAQFQYGATRWDRAQLLLDQLLWVERWVECEPGEPLEKTHTKRSEQFAGTELEGLFATIEQNLQTILRPRLTFNWQYFIDDSTPGHFFGGVGPEILGTLALTALSIIFAVGLGITAAAYLVECAGTSRLVRILRTCINTLAGVPSIVFGLFGLAFFVLYLQPALGLEKGSSILAGSLTLAVMILPVLIRASEEAIRSVPPFYKQAALSLGAGKLRAFLTVTLPAAAPGILTGIILSMSRAAGETAPILFTAAVALGPIPDTIFQPTRTLSYGSYDIAVGDRIAALVPHQQYGMVMTLIGLVLVMNMTAIIIRIRLEKKLRGH